MKKKQTFCSAIVLSAGVAMAASTGVIAPEMRNTEGPEKHPLVDG